MYGSVMFFCPVDTGCPVDTFCPVDKPLETHKGFIGHGWCHLTHHGSGERFTFGSFLYKKGDILLEWVSGKLQCEAFIGPKRYH